MPAPAPECPIRLARLDEEDMVYALASSLPGLRVHDDEPFMDREEFGRCFRSLEEPYFTLVATESGCIVGFSLVRVEPQTCMVCTGVTPTHRRRGIATALVERAVSELEARGKDYVHSWNNDEMTELKVKLGWKAGRISRWLDKHLSPPTYRPVDEGGLAVNPPPAPAPECRGVSRAALELRGIASAHCRGCGGDSREAAALREELAKLVGPTGVLSVQYSKMKSRAEALEAALKVPCAGIGLLGAGCGKTTLHLARTALAARKDPTLAYRCSDCGQPFCLDCLRRHFRVEGEARAALAGKKDGDA